MITRCRPFARALRRERARRMGNDLTPVSRIGTGDRELPLVLSQSLVKGLVRPAYKDDGNGSSRDGVVVQMSPAGGLLPIWRRPSGAVTKSGVEAVQDPTSHTHKKRTPRNGKLPDDTRHRGPRSSDRAGTRRVHQYPRESTIVDTLKAESLVSRAIDRP